MKPARSKSPKVDPHADVTQPVQLGGRWKKWLKRLAILSLAGLLLAVGAGYATFVYFDRDLPSVERLHNYKPPQVSKVFCADGKLCAEYFKQRRTWIDGRTLPPHVKNAFLAAEDAEFYKHQGLDYVGMARAVLKKLSGGHMTGASTITQQACRNILLSQERTFGRKVREWILSLRMEKVLSKDEILNLYLNEVDFGHGRWGVEEAALYYFGKHAKDLGIGEAASLAGTVQSPERINPVTNMTKAKTRQKYVLTQLGRHGFLPHQVVTAEMDKPIVLAPRPPPQVGDYYVEDIRRVLVGRYGEETLLTGGLRIDIAMDPKLQAAAEAAVQSGLEAVDHKQGYLGPLGKLDAPRFAALKKLIEQRIQEAGKRRKDEVLLADLSPLARKAEAASDEEGAEGRPDENAEDEAAPSEDEVTSRRVVLRPLEENARVAGFVTRVDDLGKKAIVDLVSRTAEISFATVGWARPRGIGKYTAPPAKMSDVIHPGEIVRVRVLRAPPTGTLEATLDQIPEVQGALVSIEPSTRHVVAMVGGYDFARSAFNRATQAHRQPGSSFKPFLYTAAIASTKFTALSIVNDAPDPIRDPYTGKMWKPQNYERNGFDGPMTLRQALTESKNTVSVRLVEALTPAAAIEMAKRAGITSPMPDNFTLALGTGEVYVLEIANAYATLQALGKYSDPVTIVRVTDGKGTVLEEHSAAFEERIPPAVAYLATSLMRSVVEDQGGTGRDVRQLNRPAVGKTGTASEYRDGWFSGYTTDFVTTAWVGFDDHASLGSGMTGGHTALPIWLAFMKDAEGDRPPREFDVPSGVVQVRVDPATGLLAGNSMPGRLEPFLDGTQPTMVTTSGKVDPDSFFSQERSRGM